MTHEDCNHCFCLPNNCRYGPKNSVVTTQVGEQTKWWDGVLCCKCTKLTLVPVNASPPNIHTTECAERWVAYKKSIDDFIKEHGPLGA